jgi:proline iminopeptidase
MSALADERSVIFYDQLGSGKSERPDDTSLWTVERFVEEVGQVRRALGLDTIHLYGLSWGSMLAAAYMLTQPQGVKSLILAGPCMSAPRFEQDALKLKRQLPPDVLEILECHERAWTTDSAEYITVRDEFYKRHVCRVFPFPELYLRSRAGFGHAVYNTMWGPSEFHVTGTLKTFDITSRLHEIKVPTLFTCGRYDECTPEATEWYASLLPGSRVVVLEDSSHIPMLEKPEEYNRLVREFISIGYSV